LAAIDVCCAAYHAERLQPQAEIGTAVNLFVQSTPRLSMDMDIDIVLPLCTRPREGALKANGDEPVAPGRSTLGHM
jgi:hypothetical protein